MTKSEEGERSDKEIDKGIVEVNISSNKDTKGISVSLFNSKNRKDLYRGEIALTKNKESGSK